MIFKGFPYIFKCKTLIPYCGHIVTLGVMIWTNLNLHYIRKLSYKFQLFWPSGSWEEDFKTRGPWATSLTWVTLALAQQWWFRKEFSSFLKTDPVVLEKNILCKTLIPCCGLALPPGGMIWSNLDLLYIRKLLGKYCFFWSKGSWEDDF